MAQLSDKVSLNRKTQQSRSIMTLNVRLMNMKCVDHFTRTTPLRVYPLRCLKQKYIFLIFNTVVSKHGYTLPFFKPMAEVSKTYHLFLVQYVFFVVKTI